jgi:hypothetical protein
MKFHQLIMQMQKNTRDDFKGDIDTILCKLEEKGEKKNHRLPEEEQTMTSKRSTVILPVY